MSVLQAVVLGAVQGLTEFVPVSSSGHLVIVPELLRWPEPGLAFDVLLHVASLAALLAYFRVEVFELARGVVAGDGAMRRLAVLLLLGSVPAGVVGLMFGDFFEDEFTDGRAAALQLVMTAAILVAAELALARHNRKRRASRTVDEFRTTDAGAFGIAQALAIMPGISRSGATIAAGLVLRARRDEAARFSFLLAVPALLGAALVELPDLGTSDLGTGALAAGFAASLVTSYATIAGLLRYLRTRTLHPFALYCVVAGLAFYAVL